MTSMPTVIETGWAPGALPETADHIENVCPEMHQSRPVRCAISSMRPRAVSLRSAYFTGAVGRSIVPSESPASWTRRDTMSLYEMLVNDSMFVSRSRSYPRSWTTTVSVAPRYPSTSLATDVTVPSKTVPSRSS